MSTVYELLRSKKEVAVAAGLPQKDSYLIRTPAIEKPAGMLRGLSRAHGDALPEVQDRIIDILVEIGARYKLPYRDIAHMLLICKLQSGFNPDAASADSSAAGLGQYADAEMAAVAQPHISKARLGFTLDLGPQTIFKPEHGAYCVVLSFMRAKELAIKHFGKGYEKKLYLFYCEGWDFQPTAENLAANRTKQILTTIGESVVKFLDPLQHLLSESCCLKFKLLTKDGLPCKGQPFLAILSPQPTATGRIAKVQGSAQKTKFQFGKTDQAGFTQELHGRGLSEIVFLILNRSYKELLNINASQWNEFEGKPDKTADTKFSNDKDASSTSLLRINHISNSTQLVEGKAIQPHVGDLLPRRPPLAVAAAYLTEALDLKDGGVPAIIEHARSHIMLPKGNQAQRHEGLVGVVSLRTGTTSSELTAQDKATAVPHTTVEESIKKKVESAGAQGDVVCEGLLFPLPARPAQCYRKGARAFNSSRGSRQHAGCDLYAQVGTEIRAMADGVVIQCYHFYKNTDTIEIDHGNFIARYCEMTPRSATERKKLAKKNVTRGEVIGTVGQMFNENGTKFPNSMLHLELYRTTTSPLLANNGLTNDSAPFQRRSDLADPSDTLDKCSLIHP